MAITVSGTPGVSATTSITLPTHASGNLILIFAYNNASTTLPTVPTAGGTVPTWTVIDNTAGASVNAGILYYTVATASNHTSGTWTTATAMSSIVLVGQDSTVFSGKAQSSGTAANTANAPSITLLDTTGYSFIVHFVGHRNLTAWGTTPGGYTLRASDTTGRTAIYTKDVTTTDGTLTLAPTNANSGSGFIGKSVEIISDDIPTIAPIFPGYSGTRFRR